MLFSMMIVHCSQPAILQCQDVTVHQAIQFIESLGRWYVCVYMVVVSTKASIRLCAERLHGNPAFLVAERPAINYMGTLCW